MSGGVDSSVAAALLVEQGHEVIGVTMRLWPEGVEGGEQGCCGLTAVDDARRVAHTLGIRYHVKSFRDLFQRTVIEDFVSEYSRGRTPNPCVRCNRFVKFDALMAWARQLGADYVATGHYARIDYDEARGRWMLRRAAAAGKDQTYALYSLTQEQIAHTLFPLGAVKDKEEVRAMAASLGLNTARKPDSQEICFVPDNDYRRFLKEYAPHVLKSGEIVNERGEVVGVHSGVALFTLGQRKGIGAHGPEPHFVVDLQAGSNRVVIGRAPALMARRFALEDFNWVSYDGPGGLPGDITARVRYNMPDRPCRLFDSDAGLVAEFDRPERAITPGQSAVFYHNDVVVGGGTIGEVYR
jgi:tRNA-specific 2-thiouridylase